MYYPAFLLDPLFKAFTETSYEYYEVIKYVRSNRDQPLHYTGNNYRRTSQYGVSFHQSFDIKHFLKEG